jgi:hypothetical protein
MQEKKSAWRAMLSYAQSVLAGLIGIQSNAKREQDLNQGGLERMIYIGLGTLVVFIIIVVSAVNIALPD